MKVTLYMAVTANGLIAKPDDNTDFTSKEDWKSFKEICERTKAVIVGRRTYETMLEDPALFWPRCSYYVLTSRALESSIKNVTFLNKSPQEVLKIIESEGFTEACVAGGSKLNSSFMKEGLIDEIFLDIEPTIFGQGLPLFAPANFEFKLDLLEVKNLSAQTIQLRYKIKK